MLKVSLLTIPFTVLLLSSGQGATAQNVSRFELGAHLTAMSRFDATDPSAGTLALESGEFSHSINPGFGGRLTFNIVRGLALETESTFMPVQSPYTGRASQWFYGVKAGKRTERLGIFAKFRPGYMYLSKSHCDGFGLFNGNYTCLGSYNKNPAVDLGAVIELYRSRRSVLRFDIGDTVVHFGNISRYQPELGAANKAIHVAGGTTHSLQVGVGVGIRF